MAVDAALLERAKGPVLRVWNLSAPAKLAGMHQSGLKPGSVRRPTGGGTFEMGPDAVGFSVLLTKMKDPADAADRVACSASTSLEGEFRYPDILEVDGKRVGWLGGTSRGDRVLVQGAIENPPESFTLAFLEMLSEAFEAEITEGELEAAETEPVAASGEAETVAGSVSGTLPTEGGNVCATIAPGAALSVRFSGTYNAYPGDLLRGLEKIVAGGTIDEAPTRIEEFFSACRGCVCGVEPGEFLTVISLAHMKVRRTTSAAPDPEAWKKEG
jgi:hypothetical protein